jgi:protoporphyrinogen oxidase
MIYDYIIIGGGISGIYAGYLLNNKYSVLILEANNYIGGRIKEEQFHNTTLNMGAGIANSSNKTIISLLKKFNIPYKTVSSGKTIISKRKIDFDINKAISQIKKKYKQYRSTKLYKFTFSQFLIRYFGKKFRNQYIKYSGYSDYVNGDVTDYIKYNRINDHKLNSTVKIFLKWSDLINQLKKNLNIRLNTTVTSINYDDYYNIVTNNKIYKTKKIIFAVTINPLNYIIKNSPQLKSQIKIDYNKYIGSIKYLRIYTYHKNGHNFKNKNIGGFNILVDKNPLNKIITISDKILMASYCDSKNATYFEKYMKDENKLKKIILYWLRKIEKNTTDIDDIIFQLWDTGVHHFKPMKNIKKTVNILQNPTDNIYVVGEMVSLHHGWVESAINTVNCIYNKIIHINK